MGDKKLINTSLSIICWQYCCFYSKNTVYLSIYFASSFISFINILQFSEYRSFASLCVSRSVVSDSLQPHGLQPTRLLCPWDFPGKDTGVACHFLLQFASLGRLIPRYFIVFDAMANGVVSLISFWYFVVTI